MKKSKVIESASNNITPRSRINSSTSTTSLKNKKLAPTNTSKQKENNKQNQTNNVMTRRKISRDENASTLTSLNGFKNIKSKVIEPKKIVETSNIQKQNKPIQMNKKITTKTTACSAKSTPRALTRPSILIKEQDCNYFATKKKHTEKQQREKKLEIRNFRLYQKVQQNAFSSTFSAIHSQTRLLCCIKVFQKKKIQEQSLEDQIISQIKIRSQISHPNIIKFYGFFADEINFYIIEEPHPSQYLTLQKQIKQKRRLTEKESGTISKQMIDVLKYLHSEQIIHRDLRIEKIGNSFGLIKILDFTWVTSLAKKSKRDTFCGSFRHVPPQLLNGHSYDYSIDLWSLGVAIYEMVTGINPFSSETLTNLDTLTFPIFLSNQIVDLLGKILIQHNKRISLEEVESHQWIKMNEVNGLIGREFWNFWK